MPLKAEALLKVIEGNRRGLNPLGDGHGIGKEKSEAEILQECLDLGFTTNFIEYVKSCWVQIQKGCRKNKDAIVETLKTCKEIEPETLGELVALMERQLQLDKTKKFTFRLNQVVALCSFLYKTKVNF